MAVIRCRSIQDLGGGAVLLSCLDQSFISPNDYIIAVRGPERPSNQRAHSSTACGRRCTSFDTLYLTSNIIHTRASLRRLGKGYFSTATPDHRRGAIIALHQRRNNSNRLSSRER